MMTEKEKQIEKWNAIEAHIRDLSLLMRDRISPQVEEYLQAAEYHLALDELYGDVEDDQRERAEAFYKPADDNG